MATRSTAITAKGGFGGLQELRGLNKPVIAAVNGIACGGGLELALSADIILAADHATFALPEIRSGTVADAASVKLPKRIPYHIAMELVADRTLVRRRGSRALGIGQPYRAGGDLMDEARKMADELAAGPPLVFAAIKEIVREAEDMKFQDALNRITGASSKPSNGSIGPRISWKERGPSPKGAIRSGREVTGFPSDIP
jgi:crotonobetainyl-CoA hydratase